MFANRGFPLAYAGLMALALEASQVISADSISIHKRYRQVAGNGAEVIEKKTEQWNAQETAIIVCDMWDSHHCLNAVRRVNELAPVMNRVLEHARMRGVLIIHAPSGCMESYRDSAGRKLALAAPRAANLPSDIGVWCRHLPSEDAGVYPIDQSDGGEDDDPDEHQAWQAKLQAMGKNPKAPWKSQVAALKMADEDPISDSGIEIWNLLEDRRIENVILMGVHTNMCVLGRPFGLRQLAKNGKNVVLMRDMTDTMYDPAKSPYVNHFGGTELIVAHIERYVCPTIASTDFLGGEPFRFSQDRRRVVMLIGDDEYQTEVTLPRFAESELAPLGMEVTVVHADAEDKNRFPGIEVAVAQADVLVISVRRRTPPKEQLAFVRSHVAAGKGVVGIRTASHAFSLRSRQDNDALSERGLDAWIDFDAEVLGGNYQGHQRDGPATAVRVARENANHPILRGVNVAELIGYGSLYRTKPLSRAASLLLVGQIPDQEAEPIAWTHRARSGNSRVFYTSLGHPDDFEQAAFRKLLVNGLLWTIAPDYVGTPPLDR